MIESDSDDEPLAIWIEQSDSDAEQENNGSKYGDEVLELGIGRFVLVEFTTKTSCVRYIGGDIRESGCSRMEGRFLCKDCAGDLYQT